MLTLLNSKFLYLLFVHWCLVVEDDAAVGYPRVLVFARGGHFVHRAHKDIVADSIIRLLRHVSNGNNATAAVPRQDADERTSSAH